MSCSAFSAARRDSSFVPQKYNVLFILAGLLVATFASSCGSSGPPVSVNLSPSSAQSIQQGQTVAISATVTNDASGQGVTWSLSGTGCASAACGTLTNQTATSVTYAAPASVPSNLTVTVTATSMKDPSKSASVAVTVPAIAVTIQNKVSELAAGSGALFFAQFSATVQNDPANQGVTWTLTANGAACSPACGTLSMANTLSVTYTPPASVPAAPDNMPTITATSLTNSMRSDLDAFTIFDGATACGTGGNESVLNGQYAIMLQGWIGSAPGTPLLFGASFAADGTGKITLGADQVNPFLNHSSSGFSVVPAASGYSVSPDNRGCLTLTDESDNTFSFHFSLGAISGGVAVKGDIILFDQQSATPQRASGILRRQDPTAFSLSALAPNFALGADGWENVKGPLTHYALVGSFAQSGGTLSNPSFDANDGGTPRSTSGLGQNFGTIQPVATATGMAFASLQLPGPLPGSANVTVYVISSSELFVISNDLNNIGIGAVFSGRAIATPTSFSASSISPNYIFRFTGSPSGTASASIGLSSFSGGISGSVSGTLDQFASGTPTSLDLAGTYALTTSSGKVSLTGASAATSPVCYLTNPLDSVSALCISADNSVSLGVFNTLPAATYSSASLSGNFFFGSNEPGDATVADLSGVASISSGTLQGVQDVSGQSGLTLASPVNATLSITANGSGNLGPKTVAVTNGTALYFIDETGTSPPVVQVLEQ